MTRVFEILQLEPFREFELHAGEKGLQNEVTNVTMLDYETDSRDYSSFRPGDFILSSLYFAKNDESLILEAFRSLIARGISGFAIKTVYYFTISDKLRRMADAAGVPIFTFHTTYMEDIIISVNELMKEKDLQAMQADLLGRLLRAPLEESEVGALASRLDERLGQECAAAYATFHEHAPTRSFPPGRRPAGCLWRKRACAMPCFFIKGAFCCCSPPSSCRRKPAAMTFCKTSWTPCACLPTAAAWALAAPV